jgi:predicted GH43/DUF377 family glycosyl hydrolase
MMKELIVGISYAAGVMVLSKEHPQVIRYRSTEPVLTPTLPQERQGTIANVVFPSGIDRRDDQILGFRIFVSYLFHHVMKFIH